MTCASPPGAPRCRPTGCATGCLPVRDLCVVARDDLGILAGAIRFWPVRVGRHEALLLGPVAVHPTRQGEGLGAALIREGMARARADRWPRVILVGDAPYYGRFGFPVGGCRDAAADEPRPGAGRRRLGAVTGRVTPWAH
jgi:predicted N-acetyltransferase YhbS